MSLGLRSIARAGPLSMLAWTCWASVAHATPGPDSVAVLANADVPESVALAAAYAAARGVPEAQVCALSMPTDADLSLEAFGARVLDPLRACLGDAEARIEALVVMRGVPTRVVIPADGGRRVSITAALGTWRSTVEADGTPLLGSAPGVVSDCGGTPCYSARVRNPFALEPFHAGWTRTSGGIVHRPVLATMLHGRSHEQARRLLDVALRAEEEGPGSGRFVLMRGADPARGALDRSYPTVASALEDRGLDAEVVDFDAGFAAVGPLAGFFTGTAAIGAAIEGNRFAPGALVDNLTSFGAVPENFAESGEVQVSIARWVGAGAAGVHGTVDEPLNNCFPTRYLAVDYVDGATLAEAYLGNMPYSYWLNLVLGDPLLAPYAARPDVALDLREGDTLDRARRVRATATPRGGHAVESLVLYADGVEVARAAPGEDAVSACIAPSEIGTVHLLAVARTDLRRDLASPYPAAGWASVRVSTVGGGGACEAVVDGGGRPLDGTEDAGVSAGPVAPTGCTCRALGVGGRGAAVPVSGVFVAVALVLRGGRRRVRAACRDALGRSVDHAAAAPGARPPS